MKHFVFFILLVSCVFSSNNFGYSRIMIERVWTIENAQGSPVNFTGALVVNNSNQELITVTTDPSLDYETNEAGIVLVHYDGVVPADPFIIKATALVDVDYDTTIISDSELPEEHNLSFTNLTLPNEEIKLQAQSSSHRDSSLRTVAELINWVHETLEYDISYWGESKCAIDVISEGRGVCVEYSHLFISMARSIGLDTRYVSGYALADTWQPHAWVEVNIPSYGWLPADPTFGQLGILDSTHLAINYGQDQSTSYDVILSNDPDIEVSVKNDVVMQFTSEDPKDASVSIDFDTQTYIVDVSITNERSEYLFGSYTIQIPDNYGGLTSTVLLLEPEETIHRYYGLNRSLFTDGYSYNVPIYASFNDAKDEETLQISNGFDANGDGTTGEPSPPPCLAGFALLGILCARVLH